MALLNKDTKLGEDKLLDLINNTGGGSPLKLMML